MRLYRGPGPGGAAGAGWDRAIVVVTSYAIATLDAEALGGIHFGSLVLDEAQAVKNATTERAKALRGLRRRLAPGADRHAHREPPGRAVEPAAGHLAGAAGQLGAVPRPLRRPHREVRGRRAPRAALAALLRPFVLRRTKAEVAPELPARTEIVRVGAAVARRSRRCTSSCAQSTLDELERGQDRTPTATPATCAS